MLCNKHIAILATTLVLTACGGGSSNNNLPVAPAAESISQIGAQGANGEPIEPNNGALAANINAIFGGPNGEPIAVEDGDTVQDVITRAGG